jgi:hypothetical protein
MKRRGAGLTPERELYGWHYRLETGTSYFCALDEIGVTYTKARPEREGQEPWAWKRWGPPPGWSGPLPPVVSRQEARELHAKIWLNAGETPAWML